MGIFHEINHPSYWGPPWLWKPPYAYCSPLLTALNLQSSTSLISQRLKQVAGGKSYQKFTPWTVCFVQTWLAGKVDASYRLSHYNVRDVPSPRGIGVELFLMCTSFWVNYNDLTATSLGIMVSKGNHPQMALIQVSEIL